MQIKANKTTLNKIIKWSASKFNEYKKSEVIEIILQAIKNGKNIKIHFGTGSYTERNGYGWGYNFTITDGQAIITHTVTGEEYILI